MFSRLIFCRGAGGGAWWPFIPQTLKLAQLIRLAVSFLSIFLALAWIDLFLLRGEENRLFTQLFPPHEHSETSAARRGPSPDLRLPDPHFWSCERYMCVMTPLPAALVFQQPTWTEQGSHSLWRSWLPSWETRTRVQVIATFSLMLT